MSTTNNTHRTWACISDYYEPDGPPRVTVTEDAHGPLVRIKPFGHCGPDLQMTIGRWRELAAAVDGEIAAAVANKLTVVGL